MMLSPSRDDPFFWMDERSAGRRKYCWQKRSQSEPRASEGDTTRQPHSRPPSRASSIKDGLLARGRRLAKAVKERFAQRFGDSPNNIPAADNQQNHLHATSTSNANTIELESPALMSAQNQPVDQPQGTAGLTAIEHVLCTTCQESANISRLLHNPSRGTEEFRRYSGYEALDTSSYGGCHLCCLIKGKIRPQQQPVTGAITAQVQVSRSGGVTLEILAGESGEQRLGELAIVPDDEVEDLVPASPKFTFPMENVYRDAQLAKSLASDSSFPLARHWLQQCLRGHDECTEAARTAQTNNGPTRLIDVGGDDGIDPMVVITRELSKTGLKYLTLSHCWGGADILRLLSENIDRLRTKIPFSSLPKTFQDAIVITRRLGYTYLWIDSLCIIQDSRPDWRAESAIMGDIYANSVCTIAALTAHNSHEGCFFDHTRNPLSSRPCRILDGLHVRENAAIGVDLREGLAPLPLHARAWVVQERILAPRTLYYGSAGLAWECAECSATEAVPWGEVSRFSPKASFFGIRLQPPDEVYNAWMDIQISYTRCLLTRFDDRLVAISGVIKRIEALTGWRNVWGLWQERLLMDMLWFVEEPTKGRPETEEYLAPTWSWVGVPGRVMTATGVVEEKIWMAESLEAGSFGERGHVKLRSMMRKVRCTAEQQLNPGLETPASRWEEVNWDPDVVLTAADIGKEVWCLLVVRLPAYLGGNEAFDIGLVVERSREEWVRLGIFRQLREGNALFPENVEDAVEVTIV